MEKEIVSHQSVSDLEGAFDHLFRADHLPAVLIQVVDCAIPLFPETVNEISHLPEYLLGVPITAQAVQPLELPSTQKTESVQAVQDLLLSF